MHQSSVAVSDEKKHFVSLSVQRISKEPGARMVHYFLDDSDGLPNLAVIGLEQRSRHMSYAVTESFIDLAGLDKAEFSVARWKSKRAVVTWLKGFIQNPQYPPCSGANPIILSSPGHDKEILLDVDSTEEESCNAENVKNIADALVPAGDIVWLGGFTTCGKRLQHYRSFQRNGVTISVNSFIYILSISGGDNLIAYIEDLYEDNKLQKKMKVRWLHKIDEIKCDIPAPTPHAKEVFMTPFREVYLLECCNGEVTVLSWEHFQQCMLRLPSDAAHAYVCRRSFGPDVKSFDICSVTGYWQQNILCMSGITNYCSLASESAVVHKGERAIVGKRGFKAPRSSRKRFGKLVSSHAGGFLTQDNMSPSSRDTANVGAGNKMDMLSSIERDFARPGEEVELLSEDSGLRGCWHRCTVLQENLGKVNLRFEDISNVDGSGLLEEWHPLGKVASPDKLGLRSHERWTLRPLPSIVNIAPADEPGTAVDAWWDDGWWEGVLIGKEADGRVLVQLPEYNHIVEVSKVRISKDWVNGQWLEIHRANLSSKDLDLNCEAYSTSQVFEISQKKIKLLSSDFESDITVAVQSPNVLEKNMQTTEVEEGKLSGYHKWSGKGSDSGHVSHHDSGNRIFPASSPRHFLGANGSSQQCLELKQLDVDRLIERSHPGAERTIERVMWRMSRKRCREIEVLMSARSAKAVFFSVQDPLSDLELDRLQGEEDQSLGWSTANPKKHISDVELQHSRYGHEHGKLVNGSSVGGLPFNSVSIPNLVMSR